MKHKAKHVKVKVRKAARKAARKAGGRATGRYARHVRRNPSPAALRNPAALYGVAAGGGAVLAVAVERSGLLDRLENPWLRSAVVALVLALVAKFARGRKRAMLLTAAVGSLIPAAAEGIGSAVGDAVATRQIGGVNLAAVLPSPHTQAPAVYTPPASYAVNSLIQ